MKLLFIDESNKPTYKIPESSKNFILGGVIASEKDFFAIKNEHDEFVRKLIEKIEEASTSKKVTLNENALRFIFKPHIHASEMLARKNTFSLLNDAESKYFVNEYFEAMSRAELVMIVAAIDLQKFKESGKHDEKEIYNEPYQYLLQRFQMILQKEKELGFVIVSSRNPKANKDLEALHTKVISNGSFGFNYRNIWPHVQIKNSNDVDCFGLQMADFACYAVHKKENKLELTYFEKIKKKFYSDSTGNLEGYGLIHYPKKEKI